MLFCAKVIIMSNITIHCRLIAPSSTRQHLWHLMSDLNTPLINDLLQAIPQHPDFEQWCQKGKMPTGVIKELCQPLKTIYSGQPARFYTSAIALVNYIYKAWFTRQKQLNQRLEGQKRWFNILKTNSELIKESNHTLEEIRAKARTILDKLPEEVIIFWKK
jgi:hypothetical protein